MDAGFGQNSSNVQTKSSIQNYLKYKPLVFPFLCQVVHEYLYVEHQFINEKHFNRYSENNFHSSWSKQQRKTINLAMKIVFLIKQRDENGVEKHSRACYLSLQLQAQSEQCLKLSSTSGKTDERRQKKTSICIKGGKNIT